METERLQDPSEPAQMVTTSSAAIAPAAKLTLAEVRAKLDGKTGQALLEESG
jgi:hypothetical protein